MTMLAQNTFTVKRATKDGYSCSLSSYSVMLNADSNGVVNGLSAASTTVKLYQGSTAVTPVISIDSTSNCSAGISGLNVSIASVPNNTKSGYVDIKIVYGSFVKIERYSFTVVDYTIVKSYTQTIVGDQMTSYATKNAVDTLGKTVLEQSTKIEQNSKDIALKASQLDVDNLGGRMKTAEAKITPDAINLTVKSQINTAVASVQIGGRNLLLNSKTSKSGTSYNIGLWTSSRDFIVGETLTVTIKGSISSSKLFGIWFNGGSYGGYPIPKVSDGIFSTVISVPSGTSNRTVGIYLISNQSASDSWTFEWIKLEWGNKATDWSPAPEDIDSKISLRPTTDEIKSSFSISTDGISMLGKKISLSGIVSFKSLSDYSDVNGRINDAQTTANNAKDSLETLTKSLSGLVSKSQIEQAMKEEGLISGGFLKMSLIDVKNVVAQGISAQTIDAGNATLKNLTVDTVKMTNADVSGKITATSGTFMGTLSGVSGSFKSLMCVDDHNNEVGEITFNSGKVTFNSCDLQHQGLKNNRTLRFLTSNIWCRGAFGSATKNFAVVTGNIIKYYVNGEVTGSGSNITGDYVQAYLPTQAYNGNTYYNIPLYGDSTSGITNITAYGNCAVNDVNGFPVEIVIFNATSGSYRYCLMGNTGKEVLLINANDGFNNIYYASCEHVAHQLMGGEIHKLVNCYSFMSPQKYLNSIPYSGWMLEGYYDNNF